VVGDDLARAAATSLAGLLPEELGADDGARWFVEAGVRMPPLAAAAALLPASLYGEGLVRAFDRLSRNTVARPGGRSLRGRLGALVVVLLTPLLLLAGVAAQSGVRSVTGDDLAGRLLGVYVAFLVGWISVSLVLLYAYRALASERTGMRALLWGAFGTGSFVAGTSLGWVLFVSLDVPLGGVYGGSDGLAVAAVTAGWLLLLHLMVLIGYCATLCLQARGGHPRGEALAPAALSPTSRDLAA
jgi:membrane protein